MKAKHLLILFVLILTSNICFTQEQIDDKMIVQAVKDNYKFDHVINYNNIDITAKQGKVLLSGTVDNIKAKERALELAEAVKGVTVVYSQIKVIPSTSITDEDVKKAVEKALQEDPSTEAYQVDVHVTEGVVTLHGKVDSYKEKDLCANVAKSVAGVRDLKNLITIDFKADRPDISIKAEIEEALKWNKNINEKLITVEVEKGNVTLTGVVSNASEKRKAALSSWVAGVKNVDNSKLDIVW